MIQVTAVSGTIIFAYILPPTFSRISSLSIAFGIAGSVVFGAAATAFTYISGKVEEERSKLHKAKSE